MRHFIQNIGAVIALGLATTAAWGQASGEANLTIGDIERGFNLRTEQSDWSGSVQFPSISISLSPDAATREAGVFGITLNFDWFSSQIANADLRLLRRSGDGTQNIYCYDETERGGLLVDIESYVQEEETVNIVGRMSCQLGTSENFGRDIDLSDPVDISGDFSVVLFKL